MTTNKFKAGMYLLETLTSGMYNDPLSIYREYVQNSVDSIDQSGLSFNKCKISIELDPFEKSVTIKDNGTGICAEKAEQTLSSIGSSGKIGTKLRGFRGIGRLGGIAFAKRVIFSTSAKGEDTTSTQEWDCEALRNYLSSADHSTMTIEDLFSRVSSFHQEKQSKGVNESFFEVKLLEVESFRNYIFDIQRIKKYLAQVAPLPFSKRDFSHYDEISSYLTSKVNQYGEYRVFVNNEQLYRPYSDELNITSKRKNDYIESIELFSLGNHSKPLAFGWYGLRRDLLGAITRGDNVSGIRVKVGNIQVGDNHILDRCFREARFNSYFIGELHIVDDSLLPNSRRDDFVDNETKTLFYNLVEKKLGIPLSKEVREKSSTNKPKTSSKKSDQVTPTTVSIIQDSGCKKTNEFKDSGKMPASEDLDIFSILKSECSECEKLKRILETYKN